MQTCNKANFKLKLLMLWLFVQDRPTDNHKFNVRSHLAYSMLGYLLLKLSFKIKMLYLNNF